MRPLAHNREVCRAVEHNERELRQVDLVDLMEDQLPFSRICCHPFLCVESIQGRVAVEAQVATSSVRWDLVTGEQEKSSGS